MPRKKAVKKSRKKNHEEVLRRDASDNNEDIKYHQRLLESNWAKYDNDQLESNVDQPGSKFDTLITQSGKDVSTFHFKDDQFMEYEKDEILQEEKKGALGFDLEHAALHLANIPAFTKLGLQNVVEYLDSKGCKWHGDYLQLLKQDMTTPQSELRKKRANMHSEWRWSYGNSINYEHSIKSLCKRIKEIKVNIETASSREVLKQKNAMLKKQSEALMDEHSNVLIPRSDYCIDDDDSNDDDDDDDDDNAGGDGDNANGDELESLLATKALTCHSNPTPSEIQRRNENAEKSIFGGNVQLGVEEKSSNVDFGEKSEDLLEEWLDSILN